MAQGLLNYFLGREWTPDHYIGSTGNITIGNGFRYSDLFVLPAGAYRFCGVNLKTTDNVASNTRIHAYDQSGQWQRQLGAESVSLGGVWDFTFNIATDTYVRISTVDNVGNGSLKKM